MRFVLWRRCPSAGISFLFISYPAWVRINPRAMKKILLPDGIKDDIIFNILLWVPLKSLIRFRCVSNSWSNLITNPNFLRMQYSFQHNNLNLFLTCGFGTHLYSIAYNPSSSPSLPSSYDKPIEFASQSLGNTNGFDIIGYCNGLICIETCPHGLILLNPSTTEFKEIQSPPTFQGEEQFNHEYRFSYDPLIDNYLVVRIVWFASLYGSKVQVYTLGSNSWQTIHFDVLSDLILERNKFRGVFVYGSLYWITKDLDFVYSFNVTDEKFNKLPLPDNLENWENAVRFSIIFGVFGECPCLLTKIENNTIHLWLMKKYGVVESWIKLSLNYMPMDIPCGIMVEICRGSHILITVNLNGGENSLVVYDSEQETLRLVKVPHTPKMYIRGTYGRSTFSLQSGTYMPTIELMSTEASDRGSTVRQKRKRKY